MASGGALGSGVGKLISHLRGEKGKLYSSKEQRESAIRSYLHDYGSTPGGPAAGMEDWLHPEGLTPEQTAKHRRIIALEDQYMKSTGGISPY